MKREETKRRIVEYMNTATHKAVFVIEKKTFFGWFADWSFYCPIHGTYEAAEELLLSVIGKIESRIVFPNDAVSDTTGDDSSTSAGNQTPSTETPPSSTKEEKDLVIETSMESVVKFETEVERLKKELRSRDITIEELLKHEDEQAEVLKNKEFELSIAKEALEKIAVHPNNDYNGKIAYEALSQINKGEPGK